jgi:hypothetical protein
VPVAGDDGADDAVTGLSVEETAGVAGRDGNDDVPLGWALAAFAAAGGVGGTAILAWRRRWGAQT